MKSQEPSCLRNSTVESPPLKRETGGSTPLEGTITTTRTVYEEGVAYTTGPSHPGYPISALSSPPSGVQGNKIGDPRFKSLLDQMWAVHCKKSADYGDQADPLANVRTGTAWGIPNWLGVLVRMTDKIIRLQTFARTRVLANEGARDALLDLASYALIALILMEEDEATAG